MPLPPNLQNMLKQAQEMEAKMAEAQAALAEQTVEASTGGGMVKVSATGDGKITSLEISPEAVDPHDVELLQDMVLAAINEVLRQTEALREKSMSGAAGFDPAEALGALGGLGGLGGGLPGGAMPGGTNRAARRSGKKKK
jgi:DNA-binding YbaB/EbfC family protein